MTFRAPVRDLAFALTTVGHDALIARAYPGPRRRHRRRGAGGRRRASPTEVLAPLNRSGDTEGARYENGAVTAAPGFADAYQAVRRRAAGTRSAADPEHGGQGLPKAWSWRCSRWCTPPTWPSASARC